MATAYVAGFNSGAGISTTYTKSFTITAGSTLFVIGTAQNNSKTISSVTWNGDAVTKIGENNWYSDHLSGMWYIDNPDSGTHDLVVSFSGSCYRVVGGMEFSGTATGGLEDSERVNGATSITTTPSADTANAMLVYATGGNYYATSPSTGQTEVWDANSNGNVSGSGGYEQLVSTGSETCTTANANTCQHYSAIFGVAAAPTGWTHLISGVTAANMAKVNTVAKASIAEINQT